jgi:murein L,D-transpeptidase YcbB/YkuD
VKTLLIAVSALALVSNPNSAEAKRRPPPPVPVAAPVRVMPADPVEAYYYTHGDAPIWLRSPDSRTAAAQLPTLLRRAQVEGLNDGPQLAAQVESALAAAATGDPRAVQAAEIAASKAWVRYVQMLKTPPQGMLFGYAGMAPQGARPDQIMLTAAGAPSLALHVSRTSDINPTYKAIRDSAWAAAQAAPGTVDTRLLANLERARVLPSGGRYILVNAATARLTMFEGGRPVDSMKVVVGKGESPTPLIASMIHYTTFNPYWNVPGNLIREKIGPKAKAGGKAYLDKAGYDVMSDWSDGASVLDPKTVDWDAVIAGTKQIRLRQRPGAINSMGKMKFNFPNSEDIYLHDTPQKEYFAKTVRTLSNGCIRLEDAKRLGTWLLSAPAVAPDAVPEHHVKLPEGVPVYVTYLTVAPDPMTGQLTTVNDVYGRDTRAVRVASGTQ